MGFLLRNPVLWQLLILPVRALAWIAGFLGLIASVIVEAIHSLLTRSNRFRGPAMRNSLLLLREGVRGSRFDGRFVFFHSSMTLRRFWQIFIQKRSFAATYRKLLVASDDQIIVDYFGLFDPEKRIDPSMLDAEAEDFVLAPAALKPPKVDLFSLTVTNQRGFGFGIHDGDRLVFRDSRDNTPNESDVVVSDRAMIGLPNTEEEGRALGVLVGAVQPGGEPRTLSLPQGQS